MTTRVALPADPRQPIQVIDSRDLARLVLQLLADGRPGAFHAVGPAEPVTLGGLIETCARVAGLPATPLEVTAAGVLAWDRERGQPPLAHGFSPEQEQALLAQAR